ncbi:MAG: GSCFA domain-containing protein [Alistipes sp.]|nr:GSCFA domain-containing protein [Alistipes sp.]
MEFRTIIPITPFARKIDHSQQLLSLGSCFADNMAAHLAEAKFRITASPTGVLFNPESIAATLERFAEGRAPELTELQYSNEKWFSFDFHSSFSHHEIAQAQDAMRRGVEIGAAALRQADTFIITFGTAIVYRLTTDGRVVANCHKQPQHLFRREMLSVEEIVEHYNALLNGILCGKQVIFTVSPVRHLGEGLEENSLSKATLRLAINEIVNRNANAHYFPSFEIMNDDLRDYRFYAEDMTHPSKMAVDYIWERFSEAAFSPATRQLIARIGKIRAAATHRPFDARSEAHRTFCRKALDDIASIEGICHDIDFEAEKEQFMAYL